MTHLFDHIPDRPAITRLLTESEDDVFFTSYSISLAQTSKIERSGGERSYNREPSRGPDLVRVMQWYWDPVEKEEVCYYGNGMEYMKHISQTKCYSYPDMKRLRIAVIGEVDMFGVLAGMPAPVSKFVTIKQRQVSSADAI